MQMEFTSDGVFGVLVASLFLGSLLYIFNSIGSSSGTTDSNQDENWYRTEAKRLDALAEYELKKAELSEVKRFVSGKK